jgi:hypothetical protein
MIQRGSDTSFTNLWRLLLYIQSLLHYTENSKRIKRNEEKYVCVYLDAGWCLVSTLND